MKQHDRRRSDHEENSVTEWSLILTTLMDKLNVLLINSMFLLLLQQLILTGLAAGHHIPPYRSLDLDKAALLRFKAAITDDPHFTLANWNQSVPVCHFNSVTCDKYHHHVSRLILKDSDLSGILSPFLSNLTGLRDLRIINSRLSGTIPHELSRLRNLRFLWLQGNNFQGEVPASIFKLLPELLSIILLDNNLKGTLSGDYFSNCSSNLVSVDLAVNSFEGPIPSEIGNCVNMWILNLYNNQLTGELPRSLANTSLVNLDVEYNDLTGELPAEVVGNLPELLYLHLSYNNMTSHNLDPFFEALQNCSHLESSRSLGWDSVGQSPLP